MSTLTIRVSGVVPIARDGEFDLPGWSVEDIRQLSLEAGYVLAEHRDGSSLRVEVRWANENQRLASSTSTSPGTFFVSNEDEDLELGPWVTGDDYRKEFNRIAKIVRAETGPARREQQAMPRRVTWALGLFGVLSLVLLVAVIAPMQLDSYRGYLPITRFILIFWTIALTVPLVAGLVWVGKLVSAPDAITRDTAADLARARAKAIDALRRGVQRRFLAAYSPGVRIETGGVETRGAILGAGCGLVFVACRLILSEEFDDTPLGAVDPSDAWIIILAASIGFAALTLLAKATSISADEIVPLVDAALKQSDEESTEEARRLREQLAELQVELATARGTTTAHAELLRAATTERDRALARLTKLEARDS